MKRLLSVVLISLTFCILIGASSSSCDTEESVRQVSKMQSNDQTATADNFLRLSKAVPPPKLTDSQERRNLVKRLERFNMANKISYIYLISYGKIMAFYTVKGKVSSVNSMLTCTQQIALADVPGRWDSHVVNSPDLDGSYGSNGDAVFFFTTEDVYVEWPGEYLLSDQPLKLSTPPTLVRNIG
jgi:hypothetical protein